MKQLSEDQFEEQFEILINHFERAKADPSIDDDDICSFNGRMFETYGEELLYVLEMAKKNRVVTIIESDGEWQLNDSNEEISTMYYVSGWHMVNRIGYFITKEPIKEGFEVKLDW